MPCKYCKHYTDSSRRLKATEELPARRLCDATKTWKGANDEECDVFVACTTFWCDRGKCQMPIDACLNKGSKKKTKECRHCSQYYEIMEVIRMRSCKKVEGQPILKRRKSSHDVESGTSLHGVLGDIRKS